MPVVGFNIEKISVEKTSPVKGKVDVRNNVNIKDIEERDLFLGDTKKEGLKLDFQFIAEYKPKVGNILLAGHLLYLHNSVKKSKEVKKYWDKTKKLSEEIAPEIINTILIKCSVKTLNLAQDVNLPPNFSIPILKPKKDASSYIG